MAKGPGGGGARPYYDDKGDDSWGQRRWRPWFVATVVAANVAMFAVTMYINDCPGHRMPFGPCIGAGYFHRFAFQPLRQNPLVGPSASTLEHLGALEWIKVVKHHEEWRLLTCIWLHAGVFHLLANMLCLLFIGIRLEEQFGFVRIGIIYFVSGFGGSILSSLFIGSNISVGASGALLGLLGAMLSELITNWAIYSNKAAALLSLMFVVAVNLALGILPHVDNFAHIGGFITGFLLGFVLLIQPQAGWMEQGNLSLTRRAKHKYKAYQWALLVIAVLLLMAGLAVGLLLLFHGERLNGHCDWCRYLDCIPTSRWSCLD